MGKLVSTLLPAERTEGTVTTPLSSHATTWLCLRQTWSPRHTCLLPPGWPRTRPYRHLSVRFPPLRTEGRREGSSQLLPLISPPSFLPSRRCTLQFQPAWGRGQLWLLLQVPGTILSVLSLPQVLPSWALLLSLQLVSSLNTDPCLLFHFRNHREKGHRIETLGENTGGPRLCGPLPIQHPCLSSVGNPVPRPYGPQLAPGKPVLFWVHRLALRLDFSPSKLR